MNNQLISLVDEAAELSMSLATKGTLITKHDMRQIANLLISIQHIIREESKGKVTMKTYGKGFHFIVDPPDRAADVLHYMTTGHLLGGRSLDGVTWKEIIKDED